MARPAGGYFLKDGSRVPSVTTILSRFKESGALIHWAAGQAAQYVINNLPADNIARGDVVKLCETAKNAYREVRDAAADAGTLAHAAVEAWINKDMEFKYQGDDATVAKARKSFGAFLEWADQTQLVVTDTEVSMVSEKHRFGGTLDAMMVRGKLALGDWKTSNAVYADYLCQLGGYAILWEENFPARLIEGGFHLLRFDKTFGDFSHHWWSELDTAKRAFLLMRELYETDKELKKRAA